MHIAHMTPSRLKIKGLRQRWMINTIMPILVVLILAVCILALGISGYYQTGMRSGMEARAKAAATLEEVKAAMKINYFEDQELIKAQAEAYRTK